MNTNCVDSRHDLQFAASYRRLGWSVVPVPFRSKAPVYPGWQQLRISEAELGRYFGGQRRNIGVLLGEPSRWLVDVDLDHALALELAATHLPPTGAIFGRASKRRSHWLYIASHPVDTRQWRLPTNKKMVVELRSTGGQTVFPGSVHTSGELIKWDCGGEPAVVDPDVLETQLQSIFCEVCDRLSVTLHRPRNTKRSSNSSAPRGVVERARKYLAKLPPAVSRQGGHDATFRAACAMVRGFGLDRDDVLKLLRQWNETCQPPWSERELEHKVDDALKQPGWRGYLLSRYECRRLTAPTSAIDRANRHAIEHRRRARRRAQA
jgi:hypothetical protein